MENKKDDKDRWLRVKNVWDIPHMMRKFSDVYRQRDLTIHDCFVMNVGKPGEWLDEDGISMATFKDLCSACPKKTMLFLAEKFYFEPDTLPVFELHDQSPRVRYQDNIPIKDLEKYIIQDN